jgi:hypothetical protein
MPRNINEEFSNIIREEMSEREFWQWVSSWADPDEMCSRAEDWDKKDKLDLIKEYKKRK